MPSLIEKFSFEAGFSLVAARFTISDRLARLALPGQVIG